MSDKKLRTIAITDEAWAIVDSLSTERKRGELISQIIIDYHNIVNGKIDSDAGWSDRVEAKINFIASRLLQVQNRL